MGANIRRFAPSSSNHEGPKELRGDFRRFHTAFLPAVLPFDFPTPKPWDLSFSSYRSALTFIV